MTIDVVFWIAVVSAVLTSLDLTFRNPEGRLR